MDLNKFIPNSQKKQLFKLAFQDGKTKVKRFVKAYSKENAKHILEQDLKEEFPNKNFKITKVELI